MTEPLSSYEETKRHLDPYASRDEVFARLAGGTIDDITEADDIIMRWHGLYRQLPVEADAFMLRLKLPGGVITAEQLTTVAELADRTGTGRISLTTRQGIEFHGVRLAELPAFFAVLDAAGILTAGACGDQVRNVVSCPVAGIDAGERLDTMPLVDALTAVFLGNPAFANMPRKFKIAVSGCARECVPYDINDLGLVVVDGPGGVPGYAVLVGGGLSVHPAFAVDLGIWLAPEQVVGAVEQIVTIFRDNSNREHRGRARMKHLIEARGVAWLREELQHRLPYPLQPYAPSIPAPARHEHIGVFSQKEAGRVYIGIPLPTGYLSIAQLALLSDIARTLGQGHIRLTHQQNLILPDIPEQHVPVVLARLSAQGLPVSEQSAYGRLVVCTGKTYCRRAMTYTKERVQSLLNAVNDPLLGSAVSLRISGCPNGCGGHAIADIGLRGIAVKTAAGTEERFDLLVGGGEVSQEPQFSQRILARQHPDELGPIIKTLLQRYRAEAVDEETFSAYAQRVLWAETG